MKQTFVLATFMLATACVEARLPPEPADELGADTLRSTADPAFDLVDDTGEVVGAHAPICGDGPLEYFDWFCRLGSGWELRRVGYRDYYCMGPPYIDSLVGRTTSCVVSTRAVCGGGTDPSQCNFVQCNLPKPTSGCYVGPLPPIGTPVGNG